jgi:Ca2+/Na+ antiporter
MAIPGIVSSQTLASEVTSRDYPFMALLTALLASAVYIGGKRRKAPEGYAYLGRIVGWLLVTFYALYYYLLYLSF